MNVKQYITLCIILMSALGSGCVSEFVPDIHEEDELLVVEGLITDQPEPCMIKISRSLPVGAKNRIRPLRGCAVTVSDDLGNRYSFAEGDTGVYTSPQGFQGIPGRSYKVFISAPSSSGFLNYESSSTLLVPTSEVSLEYEKVIINDSEIDFFDAEGCQIYLNTYLSKDGFVRWDYQETWLMRLPFSVPNGKCWLTERSRHIMIRNNKYYGKGGILHEPLLFISNETDRLSARYSILINQYSISADEYDFWYALQNITDETGGVYDVIPSTVKGNIICLDRPGQPVLGYFSVSGKSSQRIFIDNEFAGIVDMYKNCIVDTLFGDDVIPRIDTAVWVLFDIPASFTSSRKRVLTHTKGCYDCTLRGTNVKPSFWIDE